jgi:hypothetical protein
MKTMKHSLIALLVLAAFASCRKTPVTVVVNPPANVAAFSRLVIDGNVKVHLVPGASNRVDTAVSGVIVKFATSHTAYITGAGEITAYINDVDTIISNGSTQLLAPTNLNLHHTIFVSNGFSTCDINLVASDSLVFFANGAGPYKFTGSTPRFNLRTNGFSYIQTYGLISSDCDVKLNGANTAEVYSSHSLSVFIAGAGSLYYKGNPPTVSPVVILGAGKLIKM